MSDWVADGQAKNIDADCRRAWARFQRTGRRPAPVKLNRREHGVDGWLGFCWFGQPWKDVAGWEAQSKRANFYRTRSAARKADVSDPIGCGRGSVLPE